MNSHIITIGDEILVGQTVDTNSTYIAQQLNSIGVAVSEIQSIKDDESAIKNALFNALKKNKLIIITGGLGPTNDDITKNVLTNYFNDELVLYPNVLERIQSYFKKFNKPFLEVNKHQAMLPKHAKIIDNDLGTAPGMWWTTEGDKEVISLPGVPYEMKGLINKIIPELQAKYQLGELFHHTILFQGIGEAKLADLLKDKEAEIRQKGITVSYLPSVGQVKLRLTGKQIQKNYILDQLKQIQQDFIKYCFGEQDETLEEVLGQLLLKTKSTLGTVESCTGGALAAKIVSVPGSSAYYHGSFISYTNTLKHKLVGVDKNLIEQHGAVSQPVVESMAKNGVKKFGVDYCISTSGIAGPTGGTTQKPVGTIWIGLASKDKVWSKVFHFGHTRQRNIESTVYYAMNFLRRIILEIE
jgi:nicotinamide-nucleotide amidase